MSDKDLPEIPSFEELGLTPEEVEALEKDLEKGDEGGAEPAMAKADAPPPTTPPPGKGPEGAEPGGPAGGGTAPPGDAPEVAKDQGPAPWRGMRGPITLVLLLVVAWFSSSWQTVPAPVPANAAASEFSSARAMTHLTQIARVAHPPGSPAHEGVRQYLLEQLADLGHEPAVQTTTAMIGSGGFVRAATVRNIVARIPGTASDGAVLVTAHYDSRGIAKGAGDDGSGVVAILETLRVLGDGPPLQNDLIVLLTDGEELGLLGARAFVAEHPWMGDVALVVSIEMRGGAGPSLMFETGEDNGWVIGALREADPYPAANSLGYEVYQRLPNDTDFTPFKDAGKQGLNFAGIGKAHVYHQAYDAPENFSEATLQHHGSHATAMLRHFGNADLGSVDAPNVAYFSVPILGLVAYGGLWIWALGAAVLLGWLLAVVVARKRGARTGGVVMGAVLALLYLAAVAGIGHFLYVWRRGSHPEWGALQGSAFHSEGWYVLALTAAAFTLALILFGQARRWFSIAELFVGALVLPVFLAVAATVMVPMGAMNVQWPALGGVLAALVVSGVDSGRRLGALRWLLALVAAVPVLVLLTPLSELIWLSMSFSLAAVVGVLIGTCLILVLPILDVTREPNGWWTPLLGVLAAGVFLGMGIAATSPSPERPAPSTLIYALDRETGSAVWGTDPDRDDSDPGIAWALSQIGEFGEAQSLESFGIGEREYATAQAPLVEAALPEVALATDTTLGAGRVRLAVASGIGAEMMLLGLRDTGPTLVAVNGKEVPAEERAVRVEHWGAPEGGALVLDFVAGAVDQSVAFEIVEHLLRPGELVGESPFQRPPELAPNIRLLSDRAMVRTPVRVDLATGRVTVGVRAVPADAPAPAGVSEGALTADSAAAAPDSAAPDTVGRGAR